MSLRGSFNAMSRQRTKSSPKLLQMKWQMLTNPLWSFLAYRDPPTNGDNTKLFTGTNWKSSTTLAASGLSDSPCSCETQGMIILSENIPTWIYCSPRKATLCPLLFGAQKQDESRCPVVKLVKSSAPQGKVKDTCVALVSAIVRYLLLI